MLSSTAARRDQAGTAIVIHAETEDYETDPSGDSGADLSRGAWAGFATLGPAAAALALLRAAGPGGCGTPSRPPVFTLFA